MKINNLQKVQIAEIYPATDVTATGVVYSNNFDITGLLGGYNTIRVEYVKTGTAQGNVDFKVQYSALDTSGDLTSNPLDLPLAYYRVAEVNGYISEDKKLNIANVPAGTTIREFTFDRINTIANSKQPNSWYRICITPNGLAGTNIIKVSLIKE